MAFIPARLGSKRIPRKNTKEFLGVPAIVRVVRVLAESALCSRIVISSDSLNWISSVLEEHPIGFNVELHEREEALADDKTTSIEVLRRWISREGLSGSTTVLMCYPTSVFLKKKHLLKALALMMEFPDSFAASVRSTDPADRLLEEDSAGTVRFQKTFNADLRSQDLKASFLDAAQLYIASAQKWSINRPFVDETHPVYFEKNEAVDIDTQEDWMLAEAIFQGNELSE